MTRSSGIPRRKGLGAISTIIGARSRPVTLVRPTTTTNALDETVETTTEHVESMWVFEPRQNVSAEITGEHLEGGLGGLVVSDGTIDIQHNDRLTHGGVEYEVDTVVGHPNDGAADGTPSDGVDFWMVRFTRRTA